MTPKIRGKAGVFLAIVILLSLCPAVHRNDAADTEKQHAAPLVVLITLDTFRADHLGSYGNPSLRTPNLDRLSRQGALFTTVSTDVPMTLPSHCSLMTGLSVMEHGVRSNHSRLGPDKGETLADRFKSQGYETGAFIGGYPLVAPFGLDRGFDRYDDRLDRPIMEGSALLERRADNVIDAACRWLDENDEENPRPHFVWVHLYDPHHPYRPPEPWKSMTGNRYAGEIQFTDHALGILLHKVDVLQSKSHPTTVLVVGDHGESLGNHGENTHGLFLYDTVLHVPCLFRTSAIPRNTLNSDLMSLAEINRLLSPGGKENFIEKIVQSATTVIDLESDRSFYLETVFPFEKYRWHMSRGIRLGSWKLISSPIPELYNLDADPREKVNVYYHHPEIVKKLTELLKTTAEGIDREAKTEIPLDEKNRQALSSLGYLGGMVGSRIPANDESLPDAKTRRACLTDIETGDFLSLSGQYELALPFLERAQQCDPSNPDVLNNLGIAYQAEGKLTEAMESLHTAVKLAPENARFLNNLGSVLKRNGQHHEALACYRKAFLLDSTFYGAGLNLAIAEYERGNTLRACELMKIICDARSDWSDASAIRSKMKCSELKNAMQNE